MNPSFRASDARPTRNPATTYEPELPLSPRTVSQIVAATSGWRIAKFSGWAMKIAPAAGIAARIPAPIPTARLAPASRAMNHVSGAVIEPMRIVGIAEATVVGPRTAMKGHWMNEARGSQWALPGIGNAGLAGILLPTSAKIQTKSRFRPWPAARARATST
jgi:hypothetical protein